MTTTARIELDGQYRALREQAGMWPAPRGVVAVTGSQAAEYVQGQVTNDVASLGVGEGAYAALLDRKGHMRGDLRVLRTAEDELVCLCEPVALEAIRGHLATYLIGFDAAVADRTADQALICVAGPASRQAAGAEGLTAEHTSRPVLLGRVQALAIATADGVDLLVATSEAEQAMAELGERGVEVVEEPAAEILRVEAGRPRYGHEMTERTIPAEAGIVERAVSFTKGCYIGQETVARLHYKGRPNRHLRGLRLEAPAPEGTTLQLGDREVGTLGTVCRSPSLGPIALAIVRREVEPGDELIARADGEAIAAEVVELPFEPR